MSRVAVVTGAASGIGLGVARRFAEEGEAVALLDRSGQAAEQAAAELRAQGHRAMACEVDVADWSGVAEAFLFAAGQETTARLLAMALKYLCEYPELQDELREHHDRIPGFVEEALRIESPVKADFRLAKRNTTVGGVDVPAGTPVMLLNGAANRDPRRFECPDEFRVDRPNAKEHVAFGRGNHACPGGPLARAEARISLERILDRTRDIRLDEEHHGPAGAHRFDYEPTWVLRGLRSLHLEFTPVAG